MAHNLQTVIRRLSTSKGLAMAKKVLVGVSDVNLGTEIYYDGIVERDSTKEVSEADFNKCPKCGSESINYDAKGIEPESVFVYRTHACNDCDTSWEERYDLVTVTITPSKGE